MLNKKIITVIMSAIIILGTFVGCGNGEDSVSTNNKVNEVNQEKKEEKEEKDESEKFNYINETLKIKNRSQSLEKYMRNPEKVKEEKFISAIKVIDVKTDNNGEQIICGKVISPKDFKSYEGEQSYETEESQNVNNVFIKYDSNKFDGNRVLKGDTIAFGGVYSEFNSDTIYGERIEAPMFEADIRVNVVDYINIVAMDSFLSSMGQSINSLNFNQVNDDDIILNELMEKEENKHLTIKQYGEYPVSYYKDKNDVYWILRALPAVQATDSAIDISSAIKDSEGNYKIEKSSAVQFKDLDF